MKLIKNIIGLFSIVSLCMSFSNCGGSQGNKALELDKNPPFTISDVYAQDWVAGVQGGGSGTNLQVTFKEMEEGVELENVYFRNKVEELKQKGTNSMVFTGHFKSGKNNDVIMDADPMKEAQNTPKMPFPFTLLENEAVLSYKTKSKLLFFKISGIEQKPIIAYPSSNENN